MIEYPKQLQVFRLFQGLEQCQGQNQQTLPCKYHKASEVETLSSASAFPSSTHDSPYLFHRSRFAQSPFSSKNTTKSLSLDNDKNRAANLERIGTKIYMDISSHTTKCEILIQGPKERARKDKTKKQEQVFFHPGKEQGNSRKSVNNLFSIYNWTSDMIFSGSILNYVLSSVCIGVKRLTETWISNSSLHMYMYIEDQLWWEWGISMGVGGFRGVYIPLVPGELKGKPWAWLTFPVGCSEERIFLLLLCFFFKIYIYTYIFSHWPLQELTLPKFSHLTQLFPVYFHFRKLKKLPFSNLNNYEVSCYLIFCTF